VDAGAIRNYAWIEAVGGTSLGREVIESYVIVSASEAPAAATILPANPILCENTGIATLTATGATGATSYQWYLNDAAIPGATQSTYDATIVGSYKVTYYDGTCVSQMSDAVSPTVGPCVFYIPVNPHLRSRVIQ
jgi:hypothetical protein